MNSTRKERDECLVPTNTLAAGLSTPMLLRMVAPSLVTCIPSL